MDNVNEQQPGEKHSQLMSQQGSHIPKFGNWDNDNVPYTAYFENARSEKSIVAPGFNPNDPQDNPEAFMHDHSRGGGDRHPVLASARAHRFNLSTEKNLLNSADKSNSNDSLTDSSSATRVSDRKKNPSRGFSLKSRNNPSHDFSYTSASVPKFGEWDEKDPRSGEGFTVIFSKLKDEKHTAASRFPTVHPQNTNFNTNKQKKEKKWKSKICCCFPKGGR
ncbi:hypothetical protein Leryth_024896 [Lithospermum erythrorhizon]|nr:hypothetical protein Leryth_024896 [Lithospermum erythrorhizon]